jgi:probable F420-dependent oxidoreductase
MKVNAAVQGVPLLELRELVANLEQGGCKGVYFAEISHDPFLAVAASAGATGMTLGTGIALAFPRGPTSLAYTAHDLAQATCGAFVLGLGPQVKAHIERRFGLEWGHPVKRMRELVQAIRAIWECWETNSDLHFDGNFYRLSLMPPVFRPEPSPYPVAPIYLAAVGPAMARLAGEVADGLFVHAFSTPSYVRSIILPAVEDGLAISGRSREEFQLCYSAFVAHGATAVEVDEARQMMRQGVAFYASTPDYRRVLEVHGVGDLQPRLRRLTKDGTWDRMAGEISDDVLDLFCVSGGADEVCGKIRERWSGVVDQVSLPLEYWTAHLDDAEWMAATADLCSEYSGGEGVVL